MPVDLKEEDEVWIALNAAKLMLVSAGHHPQGTILNCRDCYTLFLVQGGIDAYLARLEVTYPATLVENGS